MSQNFSGQVVDDEDFAVIARHDAARAVVMSVDIFNDLMETANLPKMLAKDG